jgi:RNA polymerase sigma-70 factor (ECF subfamily)
MTRVDDLTSELLALVDPQQRAQLRRLPDLDELVSSLVSTARSAWPTLDLPTEVFLRYLAGKIPEEEPFERTLRNLCVDELYLCCACAEGNAPAVALFHQRYEPVLESALGKLRMGEAMTQDVKQLLLGQLLTNTPDKPAMITTYGGHGRLARWLRVVAARTGRALLSREKKLVLVGDERIASELGPSAPEPEAATKRTYRELFKRAFKHALRTLGPREANLLRQRYVDSLNLAQIGTIYRVHPSTVHRWLEKARTTLLERTSAHLMEVLRVSQKDCESILRMIQSDLDITLQTFLSQPP